MTTDQPTTLQGTGAKGDTVEILAEFKAKDADKVGVNVRTGNGQRTTVGSDVARGGIYVDRTTSGDVGFDATFPSVDFAPLEVKNGKVTPHILVDRSSVDVFAEDGRRTITHQIFPNRDSQRIQIFHRRPSPARQDHHLAAEDRLDPPTLRSHVL